VREVWSATVHGLAGQFEHASLSVGDDGRFLLATSNRTAGSDDVCVIEHDDAVALFEALDEALGPDNG
jgi:hypothetical protein